MLTLQDITALKKNLLRRFYTIRRKRLKDDFYRVEIRNENYKLLGELEYIEIEPNVWEVCHSLATDDFRGNGKLLYYLAMDYVYPASIIPDLSLTSSEANRVYSAFDRLDYVHKKDTNIGVLDYVVTAYKFSFRNQRKK